MSKAAGNFDEVEQRSESALLALRSLSQSTRHAPTEPFRESTLSELHVTLALRPFSSSSPPFPHLVHLQYSSRWVTRSKSTRISSRAALGAWSHHGKPTSSKAKAASMAPTRSSSCWASLRTALIRRATPCTYVEILSAECDKLDADPSSSGYLDTNFLRLL